MNGLAKRQVAGLRIGLFQTVLEPPTRLAVHETADLAGREYFGQLTVHRIGSDFSGVHGFRSLSFAADTRTR